MRAMNDFAAIILAAGASTRLGQPKQLLEYQGKMLLQHAIEVVSPVVGQRLLVVLGAHAAKILDVFQNYPFPYVINETWSDGMSTSLRLGLSALLKEDAIDGIFLLVSDQPFVDTDVITQLKNKHLSTNKKLIASAYSDTLGVPAFIHRDYFEELLSQQKDMGAKKLFFKYPEDVDTISFPKGAFDVDTAEDVFRLKNVDS
ncbi:4-diphosphocytidyl-2C-methyl-D-erythritol kinase [Mongoliitalea lutea]|uniref:4-diphosphocytidyl-2C-methyl-D-erythritol kinase n=2 Tax=Mongoliitalea lutea TaxID=849756 RepID=A0A8J3CWG0_9BACT|nr:4-diphosphocytidyl-2C-methyl-D-erythritol kinase [Mongoliitalea lutea]